MHVRRNGSPQMGHAAHCRSPSSPPRCEGSGPVQAAVMYDAHAIQLSFAKVVNPCVDVGEGCQVRKHPNVFSVLVEIRRWQKPDVGARILNSHFLILHDGVSYHLFDGKSKFRGLIVVQLECLRESGLAAERAHQRIMR